MSNKNKPNIFFVVIDSFRADRCYKNNLKTSKTPNLDNLIKNGIKFEQAISSSDGTVFSIATILTALYTFKIKIDHNRLHKIHPKAENYITHFKKNGYNTYSITYDVTKAHTFANVFEFSNPYDPNLSLFSGLGAKVCEQLKNMKEPWIFYLHLTDLHAPFKVPNNMNSNSNGINSYDKIVSGIDIWLGKFLKQIDFKTTLVVLTSDHGEYIPTNLENKKESNINKIMVKVVPNNIKNKLIHLKYSFDKKTTLKKIEKLNLLPHEKRNTYLKRANPVSDNPLYDDVLHVPLIFCGLTLTPKIIRKQVGLIDIFPTIIDIIQLKDIQESKHGQSLYPLINDEKFHEKPIFLESTAKMKNTVGDTLGLRTSEWKFFRNKDKITKNVELYNIKKDPNEDQNVAFEHPNVIQKMEKTISEMMKDVFTDDVIEKENDDELKKIEEELKKMGYI